MNGSRRAVTGSKNTGSETWVARDSKSGQFVEIKSSKGRFRGAAQEGDHDGGANNTRRPGRVKGTLVVGPEFFEPLTDEELQELGDS